MERKITEKSASLIYPLAYTSSKHASLEVELKDLYKITALCWSCSTFYTTNLACSAYCRAACFLKWAANSESKIGVGRNCWMQYSKFAVYSWRTTLSNLSTDNPSHKKVGTLRHSSSKHVQALTAHLNVALISWLAYYWATTAFRVPWTMDDTTALIVLT